MLLAWRLQIEEVVQYIEAKLKELDAERAELAEYNTLDRQRKCIEYTILDVEAADARKKLAKVGT